MFPSRFVTGKTLQGQAVTVTVAEVVQEAVHRQDGDVQVWVLHFAGKIAGLVLGKELAQEIAKLLGDDTEGWKGKRLVLYPKPMNVAGRAVVAVRVKAVAVVQGVAA